MLSNPTRLVPKPEPIKVSTLVGQLIGDVQNLIREEAQLLQTDWMENVASQKRSVKLYLFGLLILIEGGIGIGLAGVAVFYEVLKLPLWSGFAAVGFGACVIGGLCLGLSRRAARPPKP